MSDHLLTFKIRPLSYNSGYVIDAVWPNGKTEQLEGVYLAPRFAQNWIVEKSEAWKEHTCTRFH